MSSGREQQIAMERQTIGMVILLDRATVKSQESQKELQRVVLLPEKKSLHIQERQSQERKGPRNDGMSVAPEMTVEKVETRRDHPPMGHVHE